MKISKAIEKLQAIMDKHGDLDLETYSNTGARVKWKGPEVAYRKKLPENTTSHPQFWSKIGSAKKDKGKKVCKV